MTSDRGTHHLETLHRVTSDTLKRQIDSFHVVEEKVWRHAALLGVVLGGFAISASDALRTLSETTGVASWLFGFSYFSTLAGSLAGLFCFVMAMRYEVLQTDPIPPEEDFVTTYGEMDYDHALDELSQGAEEAFRENLKAFRRKEPWCRWGWRSLPFTLASVAVALTTFAILKL